MVCGGGSGWARFAPGAEGGVIAGAQHLNWPDAVVLVAALAVLAVFVWRNL